MQIFSNYLPNQVDIADSLLPFLQSPSIPSIATGLHFIRNNNKATNDFQIQVLDFISPPKHIERALTLRSKGTHAGYIDSDAQRHKD